MTWRRVPLVALLALLIPVASHGAAGSLTEQSELAHELYRELHKLPPRAALPGPETLACYQRLAKIAAFHPLPITPEPSQCAAYDLVRMERVTMPDRSVVALNPAPTLRCAMAEAVAHWLRVDVSLAVADLGAQLAAVTNADSYECRSRNRVPGAKLSEHGKGNAIDVSAVRLKSGQVLALSDPKVSKTFREQMRGLACGRFTTVLGPGSDGYHEEHIHLDIAERTNGYRICQWNVIEPHVITVTAAVPLPQPKPPALLALQAKAGGR
jgi:hypothetical protein